MPVPGAVGPYSGNLGGFGVVQGSSAVRRQGSQIVDLGRTSQLPRARKPFKAAIVIAAALAILTAIGLPAGKASAVDAPAKSGMLVLYDSTGKWAFLGDLYAQVEGNLASHFGSWKAEPVSNYQQGDMAGFAAVTYAGSTFDEPLPAAFLDDVLTGTTPVLWSGLNIWQLQDRANAVNGDDAFSSRYGWQYGGLDPTPINAVSYKGHELTRISENANAVVTIQVTNPAKVTVLAQAKHTDGTTTPWAVRSAGLTYLSEVPFTYITDSDRYLIYTDLLFDLLAPQTPERHRAMIRIEDVSPASDPKNLRALADMLHAKHVPFSIATFPVWKDPNGYGPGRPATLTFKDRPEVVAAIKYMQARGGTVVGHGYTHQLGWKPNPYNGRSGTDYEFMRTHLDDDGGVVYDGPRFGDSMRWATKILETSRREIAKAGLGRINIEVLPHYTASAADFRAVGKTFTAAYGRDLLFPGVLKGGPVDYSHSQVQFFPYEVNDVYGQKVIPETLDHVELKADNKTPVIGAKELAARAAAELVVRDSFASSFYHSFYPPAELAKVIDAVKAQGYTYVSPAQVLASWPTGKASAAK